MSMLEFFKTASPRRQVVLTVGVAAVIFAVLTAGYFAFIHKSYEAVFSKLRTSDAAPIVAELDKQKIPYRLADGGATILVPHELADHVRLDIAGDDLPVKGMVGFELFNKSDIGLTEFAQKINYQRALQGELARTIMTMDTVDTARVHLSMPAPSVFRDDRRPAKASVTLLPRLGKQISPDIVAGVQRLVAAAVPDLEASDVVVLNQHGEVVSGDTHVASVVTPVDQGRQAIEQYYAAKIRQALSVLPASLAVEVNVVANADAVATPTNSAQDILAQWTPATRSFPLEVTLAARPGVGATGQERIKALAIASVGLSATDHDTLAVTTGAPISGVDPQPGGAQRRPMPEATRASPGPSSLAIAVWAGLVVLFSAALLAVAYVFRPREASTPRLTVREREAFSRRLAALLSEEEAHGAASI